MTEDEKPNVVFWFTFYTGFMSVVYFGICLLGAFILIFTEDIIDPNTSPYSNQPTDDVEAIVMGVLYTGLGFLLMCMHLLPFFVGRKKWIWTYNFILICLGLTSCCFWPINIPLLMYWIKPECKDWYQAKNM